VARKAKIAAIAYLRTSSAANVGSDKDSEHRQRGAIQGFAKRSGFEIVDEFNDAAVSGADPLETRPGFAARSTASRVTVSARSSSRMQAASPAI
jgi:DNA invertase Pin-like site-specific DNA recombinase